MYQFLKIHFSFLMCFLVILMGCTHRKVSREFSDTMKEGSRVVIKIEYKPKSVMNSKGEKFGSYYFIAKHFFRNGKTAEAEPVLKKNPGKTAEIEPAPVLDNPFQKILDEFPSKNVGPAPAPPPKMEDFITFSRIYISFYDREGHLLLKSFSPDGYTINLANLEKNTFDGGIEWKGQFDERIITVENFRDIHSITAQSR